MRGKIVRKRQTKRERQRVYKGAEFINLSSFESHDSALVKSWSYEFEMEVEFYITVLVIIIIEFLCSLNSGST